MQESFEHSKTVVNQTQTQEKNNTLIFKTKAPITLSKAS